MLLVDVSLFWQLLRILYSYSGLCGLRHDLFLCFGLWHAYHYAHVALWNEFRSTFRGPAFIALCPDQKLMRRPKLSQSATFFTWLRLCYPQLTGQLGEAIALTKKELLASYEQSLNDVCNGKTPTRPDPVFAKYVHLVNLQTLFEFCVPVIQDYGVCLKGNDWNLFHRTFHRLLLFFICCNSRGSLEYQRAMYCYSLLLRYWSQQNLPVMELMRANHTIFSEESGEIALSVLVHAQPATHRTDIGATRRYWAMVRQRFELLHADDPDCDVLKRHKKYRLIRPCLKSLNVMLIFWVRSDFFFIFAPPQLPLFFVE